jgi:LacI family transcriptional regulator
MRISQRHVAAHLGLDHSTVSRALRRDPRIPLETRKRIEKACEELGYRPNSLISELASVRWQAGAVAQGTVIAHIDSSRQKEPGSERTILLIRRQAATLGYQVESFRRADFDSSAGLQKVLRNRGITDVILGPVFEKSLTIELDWDKFICIQLLPGLFPLPLHSVVLDHFNSVLLAWRKVVEYGYKRIGIILLDHPFPLIDDIVRLSAVHACQRHLFRHLPSLRPFHWSLIGPARGFGQWIKATRPDAIIPFNSYYLDIFRQEFGHDIPAAFLYGNRESEVSGIRESTEIAAIEAVNLLHFCHRTYQWGFPKQRIDHVIEPTWIDGTTLPRKKAV